MSMDMNTGTVARIGHAEPVALPPTLAGRLPAIAKRFASGMANASNGPLIIAAEVEKLWKDWDSYSAEAEGMSCSQWLQSVTRQNADFFVRRAAAVRRIGEHSRRAWDHEALIRAVGAFPDTDSLKALNRQVLKEWAATS